MANTINKIKTIAYATYLNAGRYTVLRNPKGTPSTVVRAIHYYQGIDAETLDTFEAYKRVTLDVAQPKKKKIHEYLFRDKYAFFNKDTKKSDYKNQIQYSRYEVGKQDIHKDKNLIDADVLDERNFKDIHKKKYTKKEQVTDMSKAFSGYVSSKTVTVKKSFAEVEMDKYYEKLSEKRQSRVQYSFLSTLIYNLKSAG